VTGEPNELVAPIHHRMPVILRPQDYGIWLGEKLADAEDLSAACAPIPAEDMRAYPISTRVNSPRNDDPAILEDGASPLLADCLLTPLHSTNSAKPSRHMFGNA
jgi:putative SOS response-associated peptidase YedK